MSTPGRLSELGNLIQKHAILVENGLVSAGAPPASLAAGSPPSLQLPPDLVRTHEELVEAIDELQALTVGPLQTLMNVLVGLPATLASLHVIYNFDIAKHVPIGEPIPYSVLSERCGLNEEDVRRFLRMAISLRLFEEPEEGMVQHNALSGLLSAVEGANDFLGMTCDELAPASTKVVEALTKYPASQEPTEAAISVANNTKEDLYQIISSDPVRAKRSANAMSLGTKVRSHSASHFVNHCGWADACPRKIIDVGGSNGDLCKALLERYGDIETAISLDLPGVVAFQSVPDSLAGRLLYQAYNFFDEQTIRDVDVVLFRHIFHNWSDKYAAKMLRNQIPALKTGSRIFLNEACIPDIDASTLARNRVTWAGDLIMKMAFNAKERTRDDWRALFAAADQRFRVVSINTPPDAADAIIEVVWEG